jgi:U3 small nucleolar RNA-associated protein 14
MEDEFDGNDEVAHDQLLQSIEEFTKTSSHKSKSKNGKSNILLNQKESISLDSLIGALDGNKDLLFVKKTLDNLGQSTPKSIEKTVSQKIERSLQYESSRQDMGKWQDTVTSNRHLRTLDLAKDKRQTSTHKTLINKFKPETDFEKEIHMVLVKSNINEEAANAAEIEELKSRNFTSDEIREKQASLAKVKSLMFYGTYSSYIA